MDEHIFLRKKKLCAHMKFMATFYAFSYHPYVCLHQSEMILPIDNDQIISSMHFIFQMRSGMLSA